jgi:flagellar protein FliS
MFSAPYASSSSRGQQFAGTYHQVGTQTMVAGASAHRLVALLFDGFVAAVHRARGAIQARDVEAKVRAIGQAARIVDEGLCAALNLDAGGRLAADLNELYAYVCKRLTQANLHHDEAALDECLRLMQPLRDAWSAIGARVDASTAHN